MLKEFLQIGPRPSGSEGAAEAAAWIARQARSRGAEDRVSEWREDTLRGRTVFRNVIAVLPGRKPGRILLGSHYDTKYLPQYPDFIGANDSGSSTALLLALISVFKNIPAEERCTLEFAFFDGEECLADYGPADGLHGSKHYAAAVKEAGRTELYRAMILLDMIGDKDLGVTIPMDTPGFLAGKLFEVAEAQGVRESFGYFPRGSIIDDHVPFAEIGIPAIDIIDFEFGPANRYWHTPEDTLDKISAESLETVGNVVAELTARLMVEP